VRQTEGRRRGEAAQHAHPGVDDRRALVRRTEGDDGDPVVEVARPPQVGRRGAGDEAAAGVAQQQYPRGRIR
jgi:hypothetical protein